MHASEILLQAVTNDPVLCGDTNQESFLEMENVRLIHGMAITRFINYVTERERQKYKGKAINEICQNYGIPLWVINARHAATHGSLPTLTALRESIEFCWDWLLNRYWKHEPLSSQSSVESRRTIRDDLTRAPLRRSSAADSTSAGTSACWSLAENDVAWGDLPIGLGPGQRLYDLDLRVKPNAKRRKRDESGSSEVQDAGSEIAVEGPPVPADPQMEAWDDGKRLELIQSLIRFLGE